MVSRTGVSWSICSMAWLALVLGALALAIDGAGALPPMPIGAIGALAYLAVIQTALAFSLWYSAVGILGPAVAGLFAGVMPIAAAVTGVFGGLTTVTPVVIGGSILVGIGIALGLSVRLAPTAPEQPARVATMEA